MDELKKEWLKTDLAKEVSPWGLAIFEYFSSRTIPKTFVREEEAERLLRVVQPMVKAYAWEHRVGSNQRIAQDVETFLSQALLGDVTTQP